MKSSTSLLAAMLFTLSACTAKKAPTNPIYVKEIDAWHQRREENLKKETGWLNLVGLFWLKEGVNRVGSDSANDVIFPPGKAPASCGTLTLGNGVVMLDVIEDARVLIEGKPVSHARLYTDVDSQTTVLQLGSLRWFIIVRGAQWGVRVRDLESPRLQSFHGIDRYPVDAAWCVDATLERYDPPKPIVTPTILGTLDTVLSPGALTFTLDGRPYRLDPIASESDVEWFVILGDKTNGEETYGGGRYLYVARPDSSGKTVIDFNKAYNPPCVFTEFATCPFPPRQNKLPIRVTAGEKNYGTHPGVTAGYR